MTIANPAASDRSPFLETKMSFQTSPKHRKWHEPINHNPERTLHVDSVLHASRPDTGGEEEGGGWRRTGTRVEKTWEQIGDLLDGDGTPEPSVYAGVTSRREDSPWNGRILCGSNQLLGRRRHLDASAASASLTFKCGHPRQRAGRGAKFDKSPRNCDGIMVTGPLTTSLAGEPGNTRRLAAGRPLSSG